MASTRGRKVRCGPGLDRLDDRPEALPHGRQRIAAAHGSVAAHLFVDDSELLEAAEPLRERRGIAPSDVAAELVEATRACKQSVHDVQYPLLLEDVDGLVRRTLQRSFGMPAA